ncbi:hypothetical protein CHARACLAT_017567 [Characodon lateralis]|uniref:Uncharacterized protein n=1 Tax=Characodon lateralis TaxID=208331 RepID=A0ABU7D7N3_9TELE|nr:hypothetical protein [Characodon lateralis]
MSDVVITLLKQQRTEYNYPPPPFSTMKGAADGSLKLPAHPGSEETVFSPDSSGSSNILGPNHPPSPYVLHSTYSLSILSGAPSPSEFVKLSTSHEETEEEGESVVDSDTGTRTRYEVDTEASGNSQLQRASQEQYEVNG